MKMYIFKSLEEGILNVFTTKECLKGYAYDLKLYHVYMCANIKWVPHCRCLFLCVC
jgi:hypothetical protein